MTSQNKKRMHMRFPKEKPKQPALLRSASAKYAKRKKAATILEQHQYLQESQDARLSNLKMTAVGLPKGTHTGLLARYNLQTDPDLKVGHAALQHIPSQCLTCCNQLSKAWQPNIEAILQDRYRQNKECRLRNVFLGLNDWFIVDLRPTATTSLDDAQKACYDDVIKGLCRQMGKEIGIGQIGVLATDDTATLGYYLVLFTSNAFLLIQRTSSKWPMMIPIRLKKAALL
jgi:hypothetical protein